MGCSRYGGPTLTTIKIAVEAKDEGRKLDVTVLKQLCAKYRGEGRICVDKFIVVSRHGFTEGAIEKARLLDVPLMSLDEAKGLDWSKIGPGYVNPQAPSVIRFKMEPHFHEVRTVPALPASLAREIIQHGLVYGGHCPDGHHHGTLVQFAHDRTIGRKDAWGDEWRRQLAEKLKEIPSGVLMQTGQPLCRGFRVRYKEVNCPMAELHVAIHAVDRQAPIKCTPYHMSSSEVSDRLLQHFSADFGDSQITWVMPDGLKSKKIAMKFARKNPNRPRHNPV